MMQYHCIQTWSNTERSVALGSAETEYNSMNEATMKVKGHQMVGREIGLQDRMVQSGSTPIPVRPGRLRHGRVAGG